jgi:hypothetical protein
MNAGRATAIAAVIAAVALAFAARPAAAQQPAVTITSASAALGETATIELRAVDMPSPGLGAWTIDVTYDFDVATAVSCTAVELGQCTPEYATGTARVSGASAPGMTGEVPLGSIRFRCNANDSTALQVSVRVLADATAVNAQTINATVSSGTLTCGSTSTAVPSPTSVGLAGFGTGDGSGPGGGTADLIIAGLAGAGIAWILAGLVGMSWSRLSATAATPRAAAAPGRPAERGPAPVAGGAVQKPSRSRRFPALPGLVEAPDMFLRRRR